MSFGEFMGLLVSMGGMLGFVGILSGVYHRRLAHKERIAELRAAGGQPAPTGEHAELVERLEHRVRVLERIATDKSNNLAAQIEDLREPAN